MKYDVYVDYDDTPEQYHQTLEANTMSFALYRLSSELIQQDHITCITITPIKEEEK